MPKCIKLIKTENKIEIRINLRTCINLLISQKGRQPRVFRIFHCEKSSSTHFRYNIIEVYRSDRHDTASKNHTMVIRKMRSVRYFTDWYYMLSIERVRDDWVYNKCRYNRTATIIL